MGLLLWFVIVFVLWIVYLELSPKLGRIFIRPNAKGSYSFSFGGLGQLMVKPFTDKTFWYPRFWDLNIYVLWIITAIIYYIVYRNLNLFEKKFNTIHAVCVLSGQSSTNGTIYLTQENENGPVKLEGSISGLTRGLHGFHVHTFGDLTNGCASTGAHFDTDSHQHGSPVDVNKHNGDLGNIIADYNGVAYVDILNNSFLLNGENSIIGRSLVVHADRDDLGVGKYPDSLTSGHSGDRIACGVIGLAPYKYYIQ